MPEELLDQGNALGYLRAEHERIKSLLADVMSSSDVELQRASMKLLLDELTIHNAIERELFYPYATNVSSARPGVERNVDYTAEFEEWLQRVRSSDPGARNFRSIYDQLVKRFNHHMFDTEVYVMRALEGGDWQRHNELVQLCAKMRAMREDMLKRFRAPREVRPGVKATDKDMQLRAAQQRGRSLDPRRDVMPGATARESDLEQGRFTEDVTRGTDGEIIQMGDKNIDLDAGHQGQSR